MAAQVVFPIMLPVDLFCISCFPNIYQRPDLNEVLKVCFLSFLSNVFKRSKPSVFAVFKNYYWTFGANGCSIYCYCISVFLCDLFL